MADAITKRKRTNRVFKSLHKPLTYLGVERTVFYLISVSAVAAFNLFNSILAGIAVFIGGFVFGHWVMNSDPAFLRILAKAERYKARYAAVKQQVPREREEQRAGRQSAGIDHRALPGRPGVQLRRAVEHETQFGTFIARG